MSTQPRCTIPYFWPKEESAISRRIIKRAISRVLISLSQPIPDLRFRTQDDLLEYASTLGIDDNMLIEVQVDLEDSDIAWRRERKPDDSIEPESKPKPESEPEIDLDLFS